MKKLTLLGIIYVVVMMLIVQNAQSQFLQSNNKFATLLSFQADPGFYDKEGELNWSIRLEQTFEGKHVMVDYEENKWIEGGYQKVSAGFGFDFQIGRFDDNNRFYVVPKIQFINRQGWNPSVGVDAGYERHLGNFIIGVLGKYDLRTDWKYWGGDPGFRFSGAVKIGIILNQRDCYKCSKF